MGEPRMNLHLLDTASWPLPLLIAAHLALGAVLGFVYFRGVHQTAQRLVGNAAPLATAALIAARLLLMSAGLVLASLEGATALIATAAGLFIGRQIVMRALRESHA